MDIRKLNFLKEIVLAKSVVLYFVFKMNV